MGVGLSITATPTHLAAISPPPSQGGQWVRLRASSLVSGAYCSNDLARVQAFILLPVLDIELYLLFLDVIMVLQLYRRLSLS